MGILDAPSYTRTTADAKFARPRNTVVVFGDSYTARNLITRPAIKVGAATGTFTVTVAGQTTAAQVYNVSTANLQTALQALTTVGSGNVTVTGTAGTTYVLTLSGAATPLGLQVTAASGDGATVSLIYDTYTSCQGWWTWAQVASRHRLDVVKNAGEWGQSTAQMLARFDTDVTPHAPGWVAMMTTGTNDVSGGTATAAEIKANLTAIMDKCDTIGARILMTTIPPRNAITTARRNIAVEVNRWLREQARTRRNMYLVDDWQALVNPATGFLQTAFTGDGIHLIGNAAAKVGRMVADVINTHAPAVDILGHSLDDLTILALNPALEGTTGTLSNSATGSAATSWTVGSVTGAAITATASKVARTDGLMGEWQQVTVSSGEGFSLSQNNTSAGSAFTTGTQVYAVCEFQTDNDWANTTQFDLYVNALNASFSAIGSVVDLQWVSGDTTFDATWSRLSSGVLKTPVLTVPANTTRLNFGVRMRGQGTVRVGRIAVYKLT
jgi:lysophospholipase L1-like esterase